MKLNTKKKVIIEIESHDFNEFVENAYGGSFEFEAQHEAYAAKYDFSVPSITTFFGSEAKDIRSGNYKRHSVHKVFQCLYEDGLIEEGNYIIDNT